MRLNFLITISNVARRGCSVKFQAFTKNQLVLPNVGTAACKLQNGVKVNKTGVCHFHVSPKRHAVPPLLLLVLRYVGKAGAVVSGRIIRSWWSKLTPEEREKVLSSIRSKKSKIAFAGSVLAGFVFLYYIEHIVEDPITKRKRFIIVSQKNVTQIAELEYQHQLENYKSLIVPQWHPMHKRVLRVVNRLLSSNLDIKEIKDKVWSVTVVDRADITNAFALPHGKIFVFTGMLNLCTNDDQLAFVLAHEIAHSILSHVAENLSKVFFVEFLLLLPSLVFWTILPKTWAVLSEWVTSSLTKLFIHLPFSRSIEKEADVVGMQLAAKSCFDVTEAPIFWMKMKIVANNLPSEWLSTHPSHETRQAELQDLVPQGLLIREQSKCAPLTYTMRDFRK